MSCKIKDHISIPLISLQGQKPFEADREMYALFLVVLKVTKSCNVDCPDPCKLEAQRRILIFKWLRATPPRRTIKHLNINIQSSSWIYSRNLLGSTFFKYIIKILKDHRGRPSQRNHCLLGHRFVDLVKPLDKKILPIREYVRDSTTTWGAHDGGRSLNPVGLHRQQRTNQRVHGKIMIK